MIAPLTLVLPLFLASCGDDDDDNGTQPPTGPNLVVESVTATPAGPTPDDEVTVTVRVKNSGNQNAAASVTRVRLDGTTTCAAVATPAITAGSTTDVTCTLGNLTLGDRSVEACADAASAVNETNENDNCRTVTVSVQEAGDANLIVDSITFSPTDPDDEETVTATITVRNAGSTPAVATFTRVSVDGVVTCAQVQTGALNAGATTTVDCELGMLDSGDYVVEACADITGLVAENDETDNCVEENLTVTPSGSPIPDLGTPLLLSDAEFNSNDQWALNGEAMVDGLLLTANAFASLGTLFLAPLEGAEWNQSGDCWVWEVSEGGCTWTYEVCTVGNTYEWTVTLDGNCDQGEPEYQDWVALRGSTNFDATEGEFRVYEVNSSTVESAWAWAADAEFENGIWTFYDGDIGSDIIGEMQVATLLDQSVQIDWTVPDDSSWTVVSNAAGTDGNMRTHTWDAGQNLWIVEQEIEWSPDGTGHWFFYDETGTEVIQEHVW